VSFIVAGYGNSHATYRNVPGVIHVGRTDDDGLFWPYGTGQADLDILAPVENVWQTDPDGTCAFNAEAGTSLGAPMIAGIIALMRAVNPCISPADIEYILKETAQALPENIDDPSDDDYGVSAAGVVDAYAAVLMAQTWEGVGRDRQGSTHRK
jgi:subtilisin family serine protease